MRVVLADLKSNRGFVNKDTVVGGYGSRLDPFSRVTSIISYVKKQFHDVPSVHMAYLAAIFARAGHEVKWTRGDLGDGEAGDVAIVLSSLVDHKSEAAWADAMRARGMKVGFIGITASKMPELFADHADFIFNGEPEAAAMRLAQGEMPSGMVTSEQINDLDSLPFPRWDLVAENRKKFGIRWSSRPVGGGFPLLASRGCPEFCTYCPHRILAGYRARSIANIADELERLCDQYRRPYVIFRDPLFSEQRDRCLELCDAIQTRGLTLTFEAETRLDRLDRELLDKLYAAGFRAMSFGVESLDPATLKKSGRRPIPQTHQREIIDHCRRKGIVTAAFYVLGFLQDDWNSIAATIDYATDLGSTFAQFKILTPYPGTPMFKQLDPLLTETDWEKFDGYTPTFEHPNLTHRELMFLLGAAYKRFYMRPSYLANFLKIQNTAVREWVSMLDRRVNDRHTREEIAIFSRPVAC
ncbi:MAG TPA: radical SAM protein [Vicinamibacterales bacterium]|jgi:anaerobic magnesium-protoporphyrin IX monomethyl ester cyclase|nr:radical SAM protein [Vicinamibacterales bacterium]